MVEDGAAVDRVESAAPERERVRVAADEARAGGHAGLRPHEEVRGEIEGDETRARGGRHAPGELARAAAQLQHARARAEATQLHEEARAAIGPHAAGRRVPAPDLLGVPPGQLAVVLDLAAEALLR